MMLRFTGIVEEGTKKGRELGFPTANIRLPHRFPSGVYVGEVVVAGISYDAAMFIPATEELLEAHLLDFSGDLYGKEVSVEIVEKIRDSIPYTTDQDMKCRISEDIKIIREKSR